MAEPEHEHEHSAPSGDEDGKKDTLGRVLKKKPWLWLVLTAAAGVAAWVIYQHFSSGSSAATSTTGAAEPVDTSGGGDAGAAGGGSTEDPYLQQLLAEDQALGTELQQLQVPQTPIDITLYTGPGNDGGSTPGSSSTPPPVSSGTTVAQQVKAALTAASIPVTTAATKTATGLVSAGLSPSQAAGQVGLEQNPSMYGGALPNNSKPATLPTSGEGSAEHAAKTQAKTESSLTKSQQAGQTALSKNPSLYG